jgi:hypothetical protein
VGSAALSHAARKKAAASPPAPSRPRIRTSSLTGIPGNPCRRAGLNQFLATLIVLLRSLTCNDEAHVADARSMSLLPCAPLPHGGVIVLASRGAAAP